MRRSKSAVVEALAGEAMRMRRFPGLAFRGEDAQRTPLADRNRDVWEICQLAEEYDSIDELVTDTQPRSGRVELALAYREWYPDEIDKAITDNRRSPAEWHELYPLVRMPAAPE